jgi:hypothetical protein
VTQHTATQDFAQLEVEAAKFPTAPHLVTVTEDRKPHISVVSPGWDPVDGRLIVSAPSRWTESEEAGHRDVTLVWPAAAAGNYSLIVDGTASTLREGSGRQLAVTPTRAVLHRPEHVERPGQLCPADCIQILPRTSVGGDALTG